MCCKFVNMTLFDSFGKLSSLNIYNISDMINYVSIYIWNIVGSKNQLFDSNNLNFCF